MASIDSITFDEPSYAPGDTITVTVGYTPDIPAVVPTTFTDTSTLTDASGNVVATNTAPFVINIPQASGDVAGNSDSDGHTWATVSDTGSVAVFTTTA